MMKAEKVLLKVAQTEELFDKTIFQVQKPGDQQILVSQKTFKGITSQHENVFEKALYLFMNRYEQGIVSNKDINAYIRTESIPHLIPKNFVIMLDWFTALLEPHYQLFYKAVKQIWDWHGIGDDVKKILYKVTVALDKYLSHDSKYFFDYCDHFTCSSNRLEHGVLQNLTRMVSQYKTHVENAVTVQQADNSSCPVFQEFFEAHQECPHFFSESAYFLQKMVKTFNQHHLEVKFERLLEDMRDIQSICRHPIRDCTTTVDYLQSHCFYVLPFPKDEFFRYTGYLMFVVFGLVVLCIVAWVRYAKKTPTTASKMSVRTLCS